MSIHAPEYVLPPPPLQPRSARTLAIWQHEVRERAGALTIVVLVFLYIIFVLSIVLIFELASLTGGRLTSALFGTTSALSVFLVPYSDVATFFFLTLLVAAVGARVVAGDLANRAVTMYLARPITALDYLTAKASSVGFWMLLGFAAPAGIADVIVLALGDVSLPLALRAAGGIVVVGLLVAVAYTGVAVLLSSLTHRVTLAGVGIFGFLIGSEAIAGIVSAVASDPRLLYLSLWSDQVAVASAVFGATSDPLDPWAAAAILLGVAAAALALAYVKLRATEVVAE